MSRAKQRLVNTETDNLVSHLRGEVGEAITSWQLMHGFIVQANQLRAGDITADMQNQQVTFLEILADRLEDDAVARLSELAEEKIGRVNFYFAAEKLDHFRLEASAFCRFVHGTQFKEMRNYRISHKELPETWSGHRFLMPRYRDLVRAIVMARRLMKKFDRQVLGPASPYLWREFRRRCDKLMHPPHAPYMLLPHLNLTEAIRARVIAEETREGRARWEAVETTVNGEKARVLVCKKWGGLLLGERLLVLQQYPLQQLTSLSFDPPEIAGESAST